MWSSPTFDVALKGQAKKMKCIFSGYPTPTVTWIRLGTRLQDKAHINTFGQELTIMDVDYTDSGSYQCKANNSESGTPVRQTVTLSVESPPYWNQDKPPEDVNTSEEESAQFDCQAIGTPTPVISWLINGVPLSDIQPDRRRIEGKDYIRYENVTKTDAVVIQCNASNKHGYIFANAFLNVLAEAPTFIETPGSPTGVVKVAVDQSVVLTCHAFGAPKPVITWKKGGGTDKEAGGGSSQCELSTMEPVTGSRFVQETNGNLKITVCRINSDSLD
jgi:receptor-type tyrosine-protein phosphatase zeta